MSALLPLAFAPLKFLYRRFTDELATPVLASDGVDPGLDIGGYPHEHGDSLDFGFEWRATHRPPCARFHRNRQFSLPK